MLLLTGPDDPVRSDRRDSPLSNEFELVIEKAPGFERAITGNKAFSRLWRG